MYIPLLFANVFHIQYIYIYILENVKRVCLKRIIKGEKIKRSREMKNMNPKKRKRTMKVCKSKFHYYLLFVHNK